MREPHERLWLQWEGDGAGEVTWCQDAINEDDIEYVRADIAETELTATREAIEAAGAYLQALKDYQLSDYCHSCGGTGAHYEECEVAHTQAEYEAALSRLAETPRKET